MHKTQSPSTSKKPKKKKKEKRKKKKEKRKKNAKSLKKKQNKIKLCTLTFCSSLECRCWMLLISQFKMFQTLKRGINNKSNRVI
jgi:hypothetical protein